MSYVLASMTLTRENALAFVRRDWSLARQHKDASMKRFVETHGAGAALRLADALYVANASRARAAKIAEGYEGLINFRRLVRRAERRSR